MEFYFPTGFFAFLIIFFRGAFSALDDDAAVRVNCKTQERMIFQIQEFKIRSLLKVNGARQLILFSENPITQQPIPSCSAMYTISPSLKWSKSFDFVTYGPNSSCTYRSFIVEKGNVAEQSNVADIHIKVLKSDDGQGVGKRGKIRLTCTMLVQQQVNTEEAKVEMDSPFVKPSLGNNRNPITLPIVPFTSDILQGSLILRFFKNVPGQSSPIPALTIVEGEDIYLVAALKSTGSYAVLRPINCTIRSIVTPKPLSIEGLPIFVPDTATTSVTIHESSILENGCQSLEHQWFMPRLNSNQSSNFRLYYTRFSAPLFSGSLRLNARCSINLCTESNSKACLNQPQTIHEDCFTETEAVPNFQYQFETITNITELPNVPSNILLVPSTVAVTSTTTAEPNTSKETEKPVFKRNITSDSKRITNLTIPAKKKSSSHAKGDAFPLFANNEVLIGNDTSKSLNEVSQEIKYCFLQRTVTMTAAAIVVLLILSIILISCSVLHFCRQRKPSGILNDDFHAE